ncbi:MAG: hypothetical protein L0Z62_02505 [Gemmataceae bacterium]|nr:hypothetical protein [Gemmataceae bacterium]
MASLLHPTPASRAGRVGWRTAQVLGVIATVVLLAGLVVRPEAALRILWHVLIPLLPASFLITPALWRSLCPLATLNLWSNGLAGRRRLPAELVSAASLLGVVLLVILVPARRWLFNEDGLALAVTVALLAAAALVLGAFFDAKAGFCNAICPVLPVEKLYGQHPLLEIGNPRCTDCTLCVPKGCLDLAPRRSIAQALGPTRHPHGWLTTVHGVFAAAFPGFVVGYYTTANGPLVTAGWIYLHVTVWAVASYLGTALLVRTLNLSAPPTLALLAAAAVGLYYWFAAPLLASALEMAQAGTWVLRGAALALVAL